MTKHGKIILALMVVLVANLGGVYGLGIPAHMALLAWPLEVAFVVWIAEPWA